MKDITLLTADIGAAAAAMHARTAAKNRRIHDMTMRALGGVELSATGEFLLFSAIKHWLEYELPADDRKKLEEK